ncbi:hypothetical protein [Heliothis virescens ascovirus 3g]|uniref:Uncharacterized protein n=1 Tax=Heliothis virescens ascovirus 3g TaxID=1246651 RepID=K4P937_9VIRU|nr:hypothetical protein F8204_gp007 [Heliothis virescens ascovirus 3g]AFV50259.1 hypothetical protein [Heliothis virescens ascovirus 3g]
MYGNNEVKIYELLRANGDVSDAPKTYSEACEYLVNVLLRCECDWAIFDVCMRWMQLSGVDDIRTRLIVCNNINALLEDLVRVCRAFLENHPNIMMALRDTVELFKFQTQVTQLFRDINDESAMLKFFADTYAAYRGINSVDRLYDCEPGSALDFINSEVLKKSTLCELYKRHEFYFVSLDELIVFNMFENKVLKKIVNRCRDALIAMIANSSRYKSCRGEIKMHVDLQFVLYAESNICANFIIAVLRSDPTGAFIEYPFGSLHTITAAVYRALYELASELAVEDQEKLNRSIIVLGADTLNLTNKSDDGEHKNFIDASRDDTIAGSCCLIALANRIWRRRSSLHSSTHSNTESTSVEFISGAEVSHTLVTADLYSKHYSFTEFDGSVDFKSKLIRTLVYTLRVAGELNSGGV